MTTRKQWIQTLSECGFNVLAIAVKARPGVQDVFRNHAIKFMEVVINYDKSVFLQFEDGHYYRRIMRPENLRKLCDILIGDKRNAKET